MKTLRFLFLLGLAMIVGLVTVGARLPAANANTSMTFVICSSDGAKTITVEQDGEPISASHTCFDCCLVADKPADAPVLPNGFWHYFAAKLYVVSTVPDGRKLRRKPSTRAPPALI